MGNEMSLLEIKEDALKILKWFDSICSLHGLKYSLAYGTLLGAVRHKGFIPWDDDIDVCMPRHDYDELCRILVETPDNRYRLYAAETDENYLYPFGKIVDTYTTGYETSTDCGVELGVFIDIFPCDSDAPTAIEREKRKKVYLRYESILEFARQRKHSAEGFKNLIALIADWVLRIYGKKKITKRFVSDGKRFNSLNSEKICIWAFYNLGPSVSNSFFEEIIKIEFEGELFSVSKNYIEFLENRYGDYMKMPPIEERVPHHELVAFWKKENR